MTKLVATRILIFIAFCVHYLFVPFFPGYRPSNN